MQTDRIHEPPLVLGHLRVDGWRSEGDGVWLGHGPGIVVRARHLGRLTPVQQGAVAGRLARRVRELQRALAGNGHPWIARPLAAGVIADGVGRRSSAYAWLAAECGAATLSPWTSSYLALDTLAEALAFLHDRHLRHGWICGSTLAIQDDGRVLVLPWLPLDGDPQPQSEPAPVGSQILNGLVYSAPDDVAAFGRLLPSGDAEYREIAELCRERGRERPAAGRALLVKLRATRHAARFQKESGRADLWDWREHLVRLAQGWFDAPTLVETPAWKRLGQSWIRRERVVRVNGTTGSGKSRMLGEHGEFARGEGWVVATGRSDAPGGAIAAGLADLAAQGYPVDAELDAARGARSADVLAAAAVAASSRIAVSRPILWLLDDVDREIGPGHAAVRALEGRALCESAGSECGMYVVTSSTLATEAPAGQPARPAEAAISSRADGDVPVITLLPFEAADCRALVASLFGRSEESDRFAAVVHQETSGDVFHAVELLRDLIECGMVQPRGSRWEIGWRRMGLEPPSEVAPRPECGERTFAVPRGLSTLMARRFAGLDEMERALLTALAVAEGEADVELVARVLGRDEDDVLDAAERLTRRHVLRMGNTEPEPVAFRDRQTRKYFAAVSSGDALPRLAGAWLAAYESRWGKVDVPGPLESWRQAPEPVEQRERERRVGVLARQAFAAGDVARARCYGQLAAAAAHRVSDFRGAREWYHRCLELGGGSDAVEQMWRLGENEARRILGDWTSAEEGFRATLEWARRERNVEVEIHALLGLCGALHPAGRWVEIVRLARRALRFSELLGAVDLQCCAHQIIAHAQRGRGFTVLAVHAAERALTLAMGGQSDREVRIRHLLCLLLVAEGEFAEALAQLDKLEPIAAALRDERQTIWCRMTRGSIAQQCGRLRDAQEQYVSAAEGAQRLGDDLNHALSALGVSHAAMGRMDWRESQRWLRVAGLVNMRSPNAFTSAAIEWHDCWLLFLQGRVQQLRRRLPNLARAVEIASDPMLRACATGLIGVLAQHDGDHRSASLNFEIASRDAALAGSGFCRFLFLANAVMCQLELSRDGGSFDEAAAVRQLTEVRRFALRTNSVDLEFRAASGLAALGFESRVNASQAFVRYCEAVGASVGELFERADLRMFTSELPSASGMADKLAENHHYKHQSERHCESSSPDNIPSRVPTLVLAG